MSLPVESDPCTASLTATRSFLGEGLDREQERVWREHLEECGECRDDYRASVVTAARIGRRRREEKQEEDHEERRQRFRRQVREAGEPRRRISFSRLRILLYPALLFLMVQSYSWGPSRRATGLGVTWEQGRVLVGESEVRGPSPLESGHLLELDAGARAEVHGKHRALSVRGPARLLVESAARERLRLVEGEVLHEGPGVLITALGVIEVRSGRSRVVLGEGRLHLECVAGASSLLGPSGQVVLGPGESTSLSSGD